MNKVLPSYRIGDLVWCKWSTIWWPAMISYDPHTAVYYKTAEDKISFYHLQYFGLVAKRAWVTAKAVIPMKSIDEKVRKKPLRKKQLEDYDMAMSEAAHAITLDLKQRKLKFIFNFLPNNETKAVHTSTIKKLPKQPLNKTIQRKVKFKPRTFGVGASTVPVLTTVDSSVDQVSDANKQKIAVKKIPTDEGITSKKNIRYSLRSSVTKGSVCTTVNNPQLIVQYLDTQGQDSGCETSSDLSCTPSLQISAVLTPPSIPSEADSMEIDIPPDPETNESPDFEANVSLDPETKESQDPETNESPDFETNMSLDPETKESPDLGTNKSPDLETNMSLDTETKVSPDPEMKKLPDPEKNMSLDTETKVSPDPEAKELPDPEKNMSLDTEMKVSPDPETIESPDLKTKELPDLKTKESPAPSNTEIEKPAKKQKSVPLTSTSTEWICGICDGEEDLVTCNGHCFRSFHLDCLGIINIPHSGFVCDECLLTPTVCFVCKKPDLENAEPLTPCCQVFCDKQYHLSCVQSMKNFQINTEKLTISCGLHHCAKCSYNEKSFGPSKLIQCVRCPVSFHKSTCLVAGCVVLNDKHMICYRHLFLSNSLPQSVRHFNMNCCLECGEVGELVCCDFCSAAYHDNCLAVDYRASDYTQDWLCPCCSTHDLPTYDSVVLCKCGSHRWWPAEIISDVPDSLLSSKPTQCMFLVRFFATEQYFWTHHGRVIAFTEDCLLGSYKRRSYGSLSKQAQTHAHYMKAFEEALVYYKEQAARMEELKLRKKDSKTFIHIKRNKYLVPRPSFDKGTEACHCTPESPCTPSSNCINRAIYTECTSNCPAGEKCDNQRIRRGITAPSVPFHTGSRGWGLKATRDIAIGEFVVEYIGDILSMDMVRERLKGAQETNTSNFYFLTLERNLIIDASLRSNNARFINHSCDPNCQTQKWNVNGEPRIGIFAIKDISAGTELTFDYQLDTLGNDKKKCLCGASNCSGYLGEKPKQTLDKEVVEVKRIQRKRRRRSSKPNLKFPKKDSYDDECFVCHEGGILLLCDYPECHKVYHIGCVNLKVVPKSDFHCPRHRCLQCGSLATVYCSQCPSAYCLDHEDKLVNDNGNNFCILKCNGKKI